MDMWDLVRSNAGLFWLYSVAGVFQLVGVGLVVRDLRRAHQRDAVFERNLRTISKVYDEIPDDAGPHALELASGDPIWASMIAPMVEIDMRARAAWVRLDEVIGYTKAAKEPSAWVRWAGPVSLGLGIVLAWAASMLAVR
ncbi:hypothetical protein [Rhodococcoides fascians]|uniref:hypothetical protein n=2 Tax=Rhodococcoides fascians TaxID=1828 RepID=UPI001114C526|nr:hypothetical protein [Rhodococcus fascians]